MGRSTVIALTTSAGLAVGIVICPTPDPLTMLIIAVPCAVVAAAVAWFASRRV
jgi:Sec-independent protein secretion pathway component TatC